MQRGVPLLMRAAGELLVSDDEASVLDAAMRRLAATIREHVRSTDIVARYGGDEFVVLQPEAGLDAARATAERIRTAASVAQDGIATSVSIGVASFPNVREADALFREADRALNEAKQRGKNTVVVAGST